MAGKGRPRKPTSLKVLGGEKRPSRLNKDEPVFETDEIAPTQALSSEELAVWNALLPDLVRAGVMTNADCHALTTLCQWEAQRRRALQIVTDEGITTVGAAGQLAKHPAFQAYNDAQGHVTKLLVEFGMTPSSRTRIKVSEKPKAKSGFADLG